MIFLTSIIENYGFPLVSTLLFFAIIALINNKRKKLKQRAKELQTAQSALLNFYRKTDNLLDNPDLPQNLKVILYQSLVDVTRESNGKRVLRHLFGLESPPLLIKSEENDSNIDVVKEMEALQKINQSLAKQFKITLEIGLMALLFSYTTDSFTLTTRTSKFTLMKDMALIDRYWKGHLQPC